MSITAYIGIGSNSGDRKANCLQAIRLLRQAGTIIAVSSLYYTEPVGYRDQEDFINAVAAFETERVPRDLLDLCLSIEQALGRKRTIRWGPRTIDLDILLYGDWIVQEQDLIIPHPLMTTRKFVLVPLAEIAPDIRHPLLGKSIRELLSELKDTARVVQCEPDRTTP